jgi:hypothetical protein
MSEETAMTPGKSLARWPQKQIQRPVVQGEDHIKLVVIVFYLRGSVGG